jgi:hypothetical protein
MSDNDSHSPRVSVIMAVHNGERYVRESVDSVLSQSFADFELLVVDDASTDSTTEILAQYHDERLRVLHNEVDSERCVSRNRALREARGEYAAILDPDDVALPQRLERQVAFMDAHPAVTVSGSYYQRYESGEIMTLLLEDAAIRAQMLFHSPLAHPTVIMRRAPVLSLTSGYDPASPYAEDYNLWAGLAAHRDVVFANVPEALIRYRVYPGKDRSAYQLETEARTRQVCSVLLARLGISAGEEELAVHRWCTGWWRLTAQGLQAVEEWLFRLLAANAATGIYEPRSFLSEILDRHRAARAATLPGPPAPGLRRFLRAGKRSAITFMEELGLRHPWA